MTNDFFPFLLQHQTKHRFDCFSPLVNYYKNGVFYSHYCIFKTKKRLNNNFLDI